MMDFSPPDLLGMGGMNMGGGMCMPPFPPGGFGMMPGFMGGGGGGFGYDPEMHQMLCAHYNMMMGQKMGGVDPRKAGIELETTADKEARSLRRVASTYAAQLYGMSLMMEDGEEKVSVRKAIREILLKDPDLHPYMIDPAEPPPPFPRVPPEAICVFYQNTEPNGASPESESSDECSPAEQQQQHYNNQHPREKLHPYLLMELPEISGKYPWREVERPPPPPGVVPSQHVAERLDQRWKQVVIGLLTKGHRNFVQAYQRGDKLGVIPTPPDIYAECSKREFDRQLRNWRRTLHLFDSDAPDSSPPKDGYEGLMDDYSDGSEAPSLLNDDQARHPFAWSAPPYTAFTEDPDYPKEQSPKGGGLNHLRQFAATLLDELESS
eukprot:TRINITY_DN5928_c1_g1_i1.p1 TRINITY_DN5928_c1_g1~~TRINITY_DN5928_c1_g1_i1.p1  ORF type:complete len:395 (+),score=95.68 TRINITY_DN5928_c1_g1_i1:51-1187(+)